MLCSIHLQVCCTVSQVYLVVSKHCPEGSRLIIWEAQMCFGIVYHRLQSVAFSVKHTLLLTSYYLQVITYKCCHWDLLVFCLIYRTSQHGRSPSWCEINQFQVLVFMIISIWNHTAINAPSITISHYIGQIEELTTFYNIIIGFSVIQ